MQMIEVLVLATKFTLNGALRLLIGLSDGCVVQVVDILNPEYKGSNTKLSSCTGLTE